MIPKQLNTNDNLTYFLTDCSENRNGIYFAAAFKKFISWQNEFLESIISSEDYYGNFHFYVENLKKKIPVYEANPEQILNFDDCFKNSDYKDFNDLIYTFTCRDIYNKDKINYQRYNRFKIDSLAIEKDLAKLLLPEKCLFEGEHNLNFMIFWGEGFRGFQSENISKFYVKYPQKDLNEEEKKKIYSDINKLYIDKKYNFKQFFGSMQLLINFLSNNTFFDDKNISEIIKEKSDYLNLEEKCCEFFSNNELKINQLMSIYFYVEHLSFNELIKLLKPDYKKLIDEKVIKEIKTKLENKKEKEIIPWKEVAAAVRTFISRYLIGEFSTVKIDENRDLVSQLLRAELWEEKYGELDDFEDLIFSKINEFKLIVGQALDFYQIIGNEDKNSIISLESYKDTDNKEITYTGLSDDDDEKLE